MVYSLLGPYNSTKKCGAPFIWDSDLKKCHLCLPLVSPPFFGRQTHLRKSLFASMILIWIYFMRKKLVIFICQKTPYTNVLLVKLYINEQISYEFSIRLIQRLIIRLIRRLATVLVFCLISVCQILFYWFMALIHVGGSIEVGTTGWPSRIQGAPHFLC